MTPKEFRIVLDDLGLKSNSGHTLTGADTPNAKYTMYSNWAAACEDFAIISQKYIVCGYLFDYERKTIDQYKKIAVLFNKSGKIASEQGLRFAFHNHDFEFQNLEGQLPYDLLLANTDPKHVNFELDLYWIKKADKNPITYFNKHKGRFLLWHIKDMEAGSDKFFTEVGNGIIKLVRNLCCESDCRYATFLRRTRCM
jgi:sugar phosphate isomerase/epimerase